MNLKQPWNRHYQTEKSRQFYPDENLVRLLATAEREGLDVKKARVLDYGFGSGRHLQLLLDLRFGQISGYEISDVALQNAKQIFSDLNLQIRKEGQSRLPDADQSYDVIVCWGVLHYLSARQRSELLSEFARLLTVGGLLMGTLRSDRDTHFQHSDVSDASIALFSEKDVLTELNSYFSDVRLGLMERTPLSKLDQRISHWFFMARRN